MDGGPHAAGMTLRGVRTVRVGPDEVVLRRGLAEIRLTLPGIVRIVERLSELADGTVGEDDLVGAFDLDVQPQVRRLVSGLKSRGLLHPPISDNPADAFWLSMTAFTQDGASRVAAASVVVIGAGAVAEAVSDALHACGVGEVTRCAQTDAPPPADVWCAASEAPTEPGASLLGAGEAAMHAGTVFLPVWLEDLLGRVGPLTYPFDTACLKCLLLRVDSTDPQLEIHRRMRVDGGDEQSGTGFLPPMATITGQVAAMEVVKHVAGLPVTTVGHAIEVGLVPFRSDVRRVLRVPRCPLCSGVADRGTPVVAHASQLIR